MSHLLKILTLLGLLLTAAPVFSADVQFHKLFRPGRVEPDGSGDYDRLLEKIFEEVSMPLVAAAVPIKRARRDLLTRTGTCITPFSLEMFVLHNVEPTARDFISSVPIDLISTHILTRPGDTIIRSKEDLAGKRVAVWWGIPVVNYFAGTGVEIVNVTSEDKAAQLLMAGRVEAAWGWLPDSPIQYERLGFDQPSFDPDFSFVTTTAGIVCNKTPETIKLVKELDIVINAMRLDGRLKKLLSPYARIVGVDMPMPASDK